MQTRDNPIDPKLLSTTASILIGMAKQDAAAIYERALVRCTVKGPAAERFLNMLEATPVADQSPLAVFKRRYPMPRFAQRRPLRTN